MRHSLLAAVATALLPLSLSAQAPRAEPDLDAVRAATEKYRDIEVAIADGYIAPMPMCEEAPMMGLPAEHGAMGVHYARMDLLGVTAPPNPRVAGTGTHTDFLQPAVLLYEPQADGSMELVGVENLVFVDAWRAAGNDGPPTFLGQAWDHMADDPSTELDEAHMFEPHYDRHVWIFRDNPNGVFAQFNPAVTCEHFRGPAHGEHGGH